MKLSIILEINVECLYKSELHAYTHIYIKPYQQYDLKEMQIKAGSLTHTILKRTCFNFTPKK